MYPISSSYNPLYTTTSPSTAAISSGSAYIDSILGTHERPTSPSTAGSLSPPPLEDDKDEDSDDDEAEDAGQKTGKNYL